MIRRNPDFFALALLLVVFGVASVGYRAAEMALSSAPVLRRIGVLSKHLEAETDDLAERIERHVERQAGSLDRKVNEQAERVQKKLNERIADKLGKMGRITQ
jgi:hypothetical protein